MPVLWAPNDPPGTWATLPVTFVLGPPASRDVGDAAGAEIDVATRAWSHVACTSWRATYGGTQNLVAADDGVNVVLFHDDAWPGDLLPGAVAQTVISLDAQGHIHDADIHLNGVDFRFSLDGAPGTQDLRSVLTHELGHALGLGHSSDPRATMYATGSGLRWRSLEQDDMDGVCALYPGTGAPGCDAVPCPASFVCVADVCQRLGDRADVCSPCTRVEGACEAAGDTARCIDIGAGATSGLVCGRECASDADCGAAFHCKATSAAGDLQCVSDDGCAHAANTCGSDDACDASVCRGGACVGLQDDAGIDSGVVDASANDAGTNAPTTTDSGCGCHQHTPLGGTASALGLAIAFALAALRRRRRLTRPSR